LFMTALLAKFLEKLLFLVTLLNQKDTF